MAKAWVAGMVGTSTLQGRRLLVVEDEYFIADDIVRRLRDDGAHVIGPVGTVDDALDLLDNTATLDGAVLDLNLHGEMAFAVASTLKDRGVPFVFATGYDRASIPPCYADVARCEKPVDVSKIVRALFMQAGVTQTIHNVSD